MWERGLRESNWWSGKLVLMDKLSCVSPTRSSLVRASCIILLDSPCALDFEVEEGTFRHASKSSIHSPSDWSRR